ncbi:teashirt homolog 1 [Esox lucius]|uniref:teashirt homolog 1 n=1 Tax=Esox lucius TaxID=8010 RepID=UPI001476A491|nr:teashirt homolog 1 [Esox lucius]XP_019905568.2 teashirt homolog 1 [Esox lucius]XP_034150796.1 teashirt homolog 1 [Esox lucius]XP_034150797.1 teashirt homolog 1 [Esox lucius]
MPRRKQQAPRRSVAYGDEEEFKADEKIDEEHLQDDGLSLDGQDGEYLGNEDDDVGDRFSFQNSPLSNGTNPDAGYASPLSDTSDQLIDFQSPNPNPTKDTRDKEVEEEIREVEHLEAPNSLSLQDSLAQMKAVYANLISDASWSSITMDMLRSNGSSNKVSTVTSNSNGSSHKGSNGIPNGHANSLVNTNNHTSSGSSSGTSAATNTGTNTTTTSIANTTNNCTGGVAYDWHQAALAKTLQHTPYHLLPEPSLFSTVQLYRQNNKLYGPVFTGASKFRCKDCSGAYDTLVGLTVHMNESGHYRDDNKDKEEERGKRWAKPRKRSLMEMEGKEDAQKVLKCMYCGHSFESLQDLSVHMIKTKHYQKVPLKEPMPALTSKLVPPTKKRAYQDLVSPCSPESVHNTTVNLGENPKDQKVVNPYVTANNRYGYQNGASYTWQFEARKAQILKCMECGSSHDTLQQLTAHMMVTGHFLKVTNSASKKGKQLVFDHVVEEKIQSIPLPPTSTRLPVPNVKSQPDSPPRHSFPTEEKREERDEDKMETSQPEKKIKEEKEDPTEKSEKAGKAGHCKYLTEEDLEETPKGGLDILKSLENTVSSAISKAQTGTPTWGGAGYPSIHAAYQLQGSLKQSVQVVQPLFSTSSLKVMSSDSSNLIHSPSSPSPPLSHKSNVMAMEELVEKVTGKVSVKKEKEEKTSENKCKVRSAKSPSPLSKERKGSPRPDSLNKPVKNIAVEDQSESRKQGETKQRSDPVTKNRTDVPKTVSNGCNSLGIITDHSPEQPFVNPLSALQSIMNNHLGKASKTVTPFLDPLAMLYKISNNMMEKPVNNSTQVKQAESINKFYDNDDQPMDLTKSKTTNGRTANSAPTNGRAVNSTSTTQNNPTNCNNNNSNRPILSTLSESLSSPLRENALMDISDMVKNLTGRLTPKSSTPSSISEKSDADNSGFEDGLEELSTVQKQKGRQSNWNPQHLLILQAQFTSCLREMSDGKFVITDLGPQERVHICKFTGLSMTTISHWLANVKYQLRRTGGTKFLKNIDSGQPLFLCSDCASQFRTPSSYITHLESHLGFSMKDLAKLSIDLLREQQAVTRMITDKTFSSLGLTEEDSGSVFQCKLCNRTFVSKHAVKLHLSKTHGKSPDDHLIFVTELEKFDKA